MDCAKHKMFKIKLVQDIEVHEKVECSVKVHAITDLRDDVIINCPKTPEYKYNDRFLCTYHFKHLKKDSEERKVPPPPLPRDIFLDDVVMR